MYFNSRDAAKSAGYFSRRHKSSEAHERSREGLKVRNFTPDVHRSKKAQLAELDARLGKDIGAERERARLALKK